MMLALTFALVSVLLAFLAWFLIYRKYYARSYYEWISRGGFFQRKVAAIERAFFGKDFEEIKSKVKEFYEDYQRQESEEEFEVERREKLSRARRERVRRTTKVKKKTASGSGKVKERVANQATTKSSRFQRATHAGKVGEGQSSSARKHLLYKPEESVKLSKEARLASQKLSELFARGRTMSARTLKEVLALIKALSERDVKLLLEHYQKISVGEEQQESRLAKFFASARTKRDVVKFLVENMVEGLQLMLENVRERISELRKKGVDVEYESTLALSVPGKIKMFSATLSLADFNRAIGVLEKLDNSLAEKEGRLSENGKGKG